MQHENTNGVPEWDVPHDSPGLSRRKALAGMVAASLAPIFLATGAIGAAEARAAGCDGSSPVNVIIPKDHVPSAISGNPERYRKRLTRATMDFIESKYQGCVMPVWGVKFCGPDLERRIYNIAYWIIQGVRENLDLYPVDPAWVMAQIMTESFFYEFAISYATAVGVCQFIPPTAESYGMVVAGESTGGGHPPFKLPQYADQYDHWRELRSEIRRLRSRNARFSVNTESMKAVLEAVVRGEKPPEAEAHLAYLEEREKLEAKREEARKLFKEYLEANFKGRDIFNKKDVAFLRGFDERATYRKPVPAMVNMLASALKARGGNMVAAAAAFHAGLSNTLDTGYYKRYGRIPSFSSTVVYVSRLMVNHHEIVSRLG